VRELIPTKYRHSDITPIQVTQTGQKADSTVLLVLRWLEIMQI